MLLEHAVFGNWRVLFLSGFWRGTASQLARRKVRGNFVAALWRRSPVSLSRVTAFTRNLEEN